MRKELQLFNPVNIYWNILKILFITSPYMAVHSSRKVLPRVQTKDFVCVCVCVCQQEREGYFIKQLCQMLGLYSVNVRWENIGGVM